MSIFVCGDITEISAYQIPTILSYCSPNTSITDKDQLDLKEAKYLYVVNDGILSRGGKIYIIGKFIDFTDLILGSVFWGKRLNKSFD